MSKVTQKQIEQSKTSLIKIGVSLIKALKLPITETTIKENLLTHPEYPALSALSDVLWDWNIENLPVNLPPERLKEINYPVVAYLNENGGHFVLIESFEKGRLTYLDGSGNRASKTISTFQENWEGILLLIGEHSYGGEKNYAKNRISELKQTIGKWGISIFSCFVLIGILVNTIPLVGFGLLLTKIVGLIIGSLLLVKEFGGQHYLLNQICQVNTKTSCDAVLQSPAASFFGWFSLAELGVVYFLGSFIILSLFCLLDQYVTLLSFLTICSVLALPYTLYSIYYQGIVLKKWCVLCLFIQGILWIEFILLSSNLSHLTFSYTISDIVIIITSFLLPASIWFLVKPFIKTRQENKILHKELTAFKQNPIYFSNSLQKVAVLKKNSPIKELILGDANATQQLVVVLSLYCKGCAIALQELIVLAHLFELGITIRFLTKNQESEQIASYIYQILEEQGQEQAVNALTSWYELKHFEKIKETFPIIASVENNNIIADFLQTTKNWTKTIALNYTPLFILNDQKVPINYMLSDIKYHFRTMNV